MIFSGPEVFMLHRIEQRPAKEFSGLIEKFWTLPRKGGKGQWHLEAPPDGNFDLVFVLAESRCRALYVGPFTELQRIPMFNNCEYFCVWFRPGIMPRVADVAAGDLVNTWAVLPKVLGTNVDELGERLSACQGLDAKKGFMEKFFRKAGLASFMPDQPYCRATELVESSGGRIRVEELAETLGVTTRTLERMFREHAGVSPKKFIRLVRFQNILSQLRSGAASMNLADLACEWGYADQSHFIRDFKSLMQTPPGAI
jgi:AraC-like DNA-binding protein